MHILGLENAPFLSNSCYYSLTQLSWVFHVMNILGLQLTPIVVVSKGTEHIRSRKCHFLRLLLLLQLTPIVRVTICTENIRSKKCQFFRQLLLLQLTPVVMVTKGIEHTRSRKCHFLRQLLKTVLLPCLVMLQIVSKRYKGHQISEKFVTNEDVGLNVL